MNAVLARQGKRVKVSRRWELDHLRIEGAQYLFNPNSKVPVSIRKKEDLMRILKS
jgi:hypothetical protein